MRARHVVVANEGTEELDAALDNGHALGRKRMVCRALVSHRRVQPAFWRPH
jgi:hypothetical protein